MHFCSPWSQIIPYKCLALILSREETPCFVSGRICWRHNAGGLWQQQQLFYYSLPSSTPQFDMEMKKLLFLLLSEEEQSNFLLQEAADTTCCCGMWPQTKIIPSGAILTNRLVYSADFLYSTHVLTKKCMLLNPVTWIVSRVA